MDNLSSASQTESEQTNAAADAKDGENADNATDEEASLSEGSPAQISASEQDQQNLNPVEDKEKEEDVDSVIDCDPSVSNRFTVLSDEQPSKDVVSDADKISEMDLERDEDGTQLVSEMEKVALDDADLEESNAVDATMESEVEPLEEKEYTVVSQDPELAFCTLATRTAPEKQECSVQSCLFHFTEVETLTQNNSLLCVTCTKVQSNKEKVGGK